MIQSDLFRPATLIALLEDANRRGGTDFGHHILPRLPGTCGAYAYDFSRNTVPGIKAHEEGSYWRDVGTPEAFEAARRDVRGDFPRFDLANPEWPIRPAKRPPQVPQLPAWQIQADA